MLLTLTHHGKPAPFGTTATLEGKATQAGSGIVGDNGQVYLSGMPCVYKRAPHMDSLTGVSDEISPVPF
ncbi:FimD/PapC C-terminal domain-containing protein [Photorhabdus laumondii]|uniref:FimD/PapC C-terminal domain-containing protein n=1 Tax=Photorhabdus laumondii TaxID=2218628 RepID=UPI0030C807D0